jgi:hypothetical protein
MNASDQILNSFGMVLLAGLISCTTSTSDEDKDAPCNDVGQCLPGWICAQGRCLEGDSGALGPNAVGPNGGMINGPNGSQIEVPTGALADSVELVFKSHSQNLNLDGLNVLAPLVEIGPLETSFSLDATIIIPVDTSSIAIEPNEIAVYRADSLDGPWQKLFGASSSTLAIGLTDKLGVFAAARDE